MEKDFQRIAGVDFGSKRAGTTVIAFLDKEKKAIHFAQSKKNSDADRFILEWVDAVRPSTLFLDAPLSLPGVYRGLPGCADYFYRVADRQLAAMSPMFLGGLTARAMRLKDALAGKSVAVQEVYPGGLAKVLGLVELGYKKEIAAREKAEEIITGHMPFPAAPGACRSWHHVDALLALLSGWRYLKQAHLSFGNNQEGTIIL